VHLESPKNTLRSYKAILSNVVILIIAIIAWELAAILVHSYYFPSFTAVVRAFVTLNITGDFDGYNLLAHTTASIFRVLAGFSLACAIGIPLGLAMGLKTSIYDTSKSILEPLRFIPPLAWIPLAFILFAGYSRYVFIIWLGAFFPILLNAMVAVKRTNPILVDVSKTFGANWRTTVLKVVVPSALPEVVAGMRIGLGIGWMCIVAAEMVGGEMVGLGRLIWKYVGWGPEVDMIVVGMITIGLIGLIMNEMFLQAEKRLFRWRVEVKM